MEWYEILVMLPVVINDDATGAVINALLFFFCFFFSIFFPLIGFSFILPLAARLNTERANHVTTIMHVIITRPNAANRICRKLEAFAYIFSFWHSLYFEKCLQIMTMLLVVLFILTTLTLHISAPTDRGKPTLKDAERFRNGFRDHDHMMKALYAMNAFCYAFKCDCYV